MSTKLSAEKAREKVMVVARNDVFAAGIWHGLKTDDVAKYVRIINTKHKFLPRGQVEDDPRWQQIIPYIYFENPTSSAIGELRGASYFLMQRNASHTDKRLASNFSLGVGGHINKSDIGNRDIISWAKREFEEEVDYKGPFKASFVGLLNDDSNDVGMVHLGLIIRVEGDGSAIAVRDEHQSGKMANLVELSKHYKKMETWSQIIYDSVMKKRVARVSQVPRVSGIDSVTGILPDWVIAKYIELGRVVIKPLEEDWRQNIDQVSIDFHLGPHLKLFRGGTYRFIDTRRGLPSDAMEEVNLNEGDPFILEPGAFAIASTKEVLKLPGDVLGRLEGKSSLARLGILVHSTAARFDPGWDGAPVLELGNLGPKPAILYCGMPICAFTFERLSAPVRMTYAGSRSDRYSGSRGAVASRIHEATRRRK